MKLYYLGHAPLGRRWQGTQVEAKNVDRETGKGGFELRDVPVDKPNLLQVLNAQESIIEHTHGHPPAGPLDELEQAELRAAQESRDPYVHYETPYNARATLAEIDAGLSARAIRQFTGSELAKVAAAVCDRMLQLAGRVDDGRA
jgi:hypothetical protein